RSGRTQPGGPDRPVPAAELEEDADEDRERDAELGEQSESSLHVADRPCGAPYIAQLLPAAKSRAGSLAALRDPCYTARPAGGGAEVKRTGLTRASRVAAAVL